MSTASQKTIHVLEQVVKGLPMGTNLALVQFLWAIITGSFLNSRGAIFPALQSCGFDQAESYRAWQAMADGSWTIGHLVKNWRAYVFDQGQWQANRYEGYRPKAVDTTVFWRPRLEGWKGKFFHGIAGRALKGVGFGLVVEVGQVDGQRIPLVAAIIPADAKTESQAVFKKEVIGYANQSLADDEVMVHDAGATVADMQEQKVPRFVLRLATNVTARRNQLPNNPRGRRAKYGQIVRPLPRQYKGKTTPATLPDVETTITYQERTIRAQGWHNLVRRDQEVDEANELFSIWVFFDPLYKTPLIVGTNVSLQPESVFLFYHDRWPVEEVPLVAKQTLGLHRHFVWALLSIIRLPALALLAANILTYLATVLPPMPTGFWDRRPQKKRLVACDGYWLRRIFQLLPYQTAKFAKSTPTRRTFPKDLKLEGKLNRQLDQILDFMFVFESISSTATPV